MTRRSLLKSPALAVAARQATPAASGNYKLVRTIPVEGGYDLVVAGGGPAGTAAAVCAARLGGKVLLLEATGCLGGTGTSGLVTSFNPVGDGSKMVCGGFFREVMRKMFDRGFLKPRIEFDSWTRRFQTWTPFQAEGLKLILDEYVAAAGVEVRFFSKVIDADAASDAGRVNGIVTHSVEGYRYISGRAFIDATGDAAVAKVCGVKCREAGRDTPGIMPPTLCWIGANVDWKRMGDQQALLKQALADGFFSQPDQHLPGMQQVTSTTAFVNAGHIFHMDALRTKSLTQGMRAGRRLAREFLAFYRKYVPGCENVEMVITAAMMGVRESRRIVGEYELNEQDYHSRRQFPDQIAVYNGSIDIHPYDNSEAEFQRYYKAFTKTGRMKPGECVGIPYGVTVPKGWKNLWVAGRAVSTDVAVQGAVRVQPPAAMMGQAAGTAAMQAIRSRRAADEIDTELLVRNLRDAGAYLPQATTSRHMTRAAAAAEGGR